MLKVVILVVASATLDRSSNLRTSPRGEGLEHGTEVLVDLCNLHDVQVKHLHAWVSKLEHASNAVGMTSAW